MAQSLSEAVVALLERHWASEPERCRLLLARGMDAAYRAFVEATEGNRT